MTHEQSKEILRLAQVYAMRLHISIQAYAHSIDTCVPPEEIWARAQASTKARAQTDEARTALTDYVTALEAK